MSRGITFPVAVRRVIPGNDTIQHHDHVADDIRIGVLVNGYAGRRMRHVYRHDAILYILFINICLHIVRNLDEL